MMPAYGLLHIACNDPDNGNFTGRFREINLTFGMRGLDDSAELAAGSDWKMKDTGKEIVIRRKKFPYRRHKAWVGNWCWDMFVMERRVMRDLVRFLSKSGRWECEAGPARWCGVYDRMKPG